MTADRERADGLDRRTSYPGEFTLWVWNIVFRNLGLGLGFAAVAVAAGCMAARLHMQGRWL